MHAVLGWEADRDLLTAAETDVERLDSGCRGLAGNFGLERGRLDVSRACTERVLLPRVRASDRPTTVLADGFSCRTSCTSSTAVGAKAVISRSSWPPGCPPRPDRRETTVAPGPLREVPG
ncbi:hypothetical protein [Amycolatopsis panacis]|uniref:hypothetical protein n=1 Tax=Amycolatopsis panacis TaxID=2340917 RepID=UPI001F47AE5E|nr:hypothetical protein [Amycolatopsis panacis]